MVEASNFEWKEGTPLRLPQELLTLISRVPDAANRSPIGRLDTLCKAPDLARGFRHLRHAAALAGAFDALAGDFDGSWWSMPEWALQVQFQTCNTTTTTTCSNRDSRQTG